MATKSFIERNRKKKELSLCLAKKRTNLRILRKSKNISLEERMNVQKKLARMPRNSSFTRVRWLCMITGRSRGVIKKYCISRIKFIELASEGMLPGVISGS